MNVANGSMGILTFGPGIYCFGYYWVKRLMNKLTYFCLSFLHYNALSRVVEGRFQTILEGPTNAPFLWDTIKMTAGKFHLKIKE